MFSSIKNMFKTLFGVNAKTTEADAISIPKRKRLLRRKRLSRRFPPPGEARIKLGLTLFIGEEYERPNRRKASK